MKTGLERIAAGQTCTPCRKMQVMVISVKQLLKSGMREIRTSRSVGAGGGRLPPATWRAISDGRPHRDRNQSLRIPYGVAFYVNRLFAGLLGPAEDSWSISGFCGHFAACQIKNSHVYAAGIAFPFVKEQFLLGWRPHCALGKRPRPKSESLSQIANHVGFGSVQVN